MPSEKNGSIEKDYPLYKTRRLKKPYTETTLLPDLKLRSLDDTSNQKNRPDHTPSHGYRKHYKKFLDGTEGHWLRVLNHGAKLNSVVGMRSSPLSADVKSEKQFPTIQYKRKLLNNQINY